LTRPQSPANDPHSCRTRKAGGACSSAPTLAAKSASVGASIGANGGADEVAAPSRLLALLQMARFDALVFFGLAFAFALLESLGRWIRFLTLPLAAFVAGLALSNATYLAMTGQQGSWRGLLELLDRSAEAHMILAELGSPARYATFAIVLACLVALPIGLDRWLARGRDRPATRHGRRAVALGRAGASGMLAVAIGIAGALLPEAAALETRILSENALVRVARGALFSRARDRDSQFTGWHPAVVVDRAEIKRFATGRRPPNILVVILESTRYDYTAASGPDASATTPHMARLLEGGFTADRMRAVVPHTTKSLFTLFCGRYPVLLTETIEVNDNSPTQCLPDILSRAGYRTAFHQSAMGTFESRPRLVRRMGFGEFKAWEDLGEEQLGYLAGPDDILEAPALEFFAQQARRPGQPFLLSILTSATHDPYRLPSRLGPSLGENLLTEKTRVQRYRRLVEEADRVLGVILDGLAAAGLAKDTLVLVTGDHGEGLGAHGLRQHDDNFYEQGLRVPFILRGPGVVAGRHPHDASLLDVTPTLLGLLGITPTGPGLEGFDLLDDANPSEDEPRFFACYRSWKCQGFVYRGTKYVVDIENEESWTFDLERDPEERNALPVTPVLGEFARELDSIVKSHVVGRWYSDYSAIDRYPPWQCRKDSLSCKHPKAINEDDRP